MVLLCLCVCVCVFFFLCFCFCLIQENFTKEGKEITSGAYPMRDENGTKIT